jgi:protein tyrosine/serine phosphatase
MRVEDFSVGPGNWPTSDNVDVALRVIAKQSRRPVLIASADGIRRPGMVVAAYLTSVKKLDKAAAMKRIHELYGDGPGVADVERFLEVYDPASQKVTRELPMSKE